MLILVVSVTRVRICEWMSQLSNERIGYLKSECMACFGVEAFSIDPRIMSLYCCCIWYTFYTHTDVDTDQHLPYGICCLVQHLTFNWKRRKKSPVIHFSDTNICPWWSWLMTPTSDPQGVEEAEKQLHLSLNKSLLPSKCPWGIS